MGNTTNPTDLKALMLGGGGSGRCALSLNIGGARSQEVDPLGEEDLKASTHTPIFRGSR